MIKSIRIVGYKSLSDVVLQPRALTVFLGPHSAGKSNFFDALGLLSAIVTSRTLREAFENHRGAPSEVLCYGARTARGPAKSAFARLTLEVDVALSDSAIATVEKRIVLMREGIGRASSAGAKDRIRERRLRYTLSLEISVSNGLVRVADERLAALNSDGSESERRAPFIEKVKEKLRLRVDGKAAHPTDFDLGLDYALVSQPLYTPYYAHIAAFKEELSRWRFYHLEPNAMRRDMPPGQIIQLDRDGSGLAGFFQWLSARDRDALHALNRSLRALLPEVEALEVDKTNDGVPALRIVERGVPVSMSLISDGALRILGLLASTNPATDATLIAYEEPENGLQAECLASVAKHLRTTADRGAQVLVNTHSPAFANHFDDGQLLICHRRDRGSEFAAFRSSGPLMRPRELEMALER